MTIRSTWSDFETHARDCDVCAAARSRMFAMMREREDWNRSMVLGSLTGACKDGGDLIMRWDHLAQVALGNHEPEDGEGSLDLTYSMRARAGLLELPELAAKRRIEALMDVPGGAFARLMAVEDPRLRESEMEAIERSYFRSKAHQEVERPGPSDMPRCAVCDKPLNPRDIEKGHDRHYRCWKQNAW